MKPPPLQLEIPTTLAEALALLEEHGDEAKVIAGGQSLVPMLNLRLARPSVLVDITRIPGCAYIVRDADGGRIGALTRHVEVERSPVVDRHWPLLVEGIRHVAHHQIRNRGTIGGSLSHADPSAELPTLMAALDAVFVVVSRGGQRELPWDRFFAGPYETALKPSELLAEVRVPTLAPGTGSAFTEYARRSGDYGIGGAAVVMRFDEDERVGDVRLSLLGVPGSPVRARGAEQLLRGSEFNDSTVRTAVEAAVSDIDLSDGVHGSGRYRRRVVAQQIDQALRKAASRARRGSR